MKRYTQTLWQPAAGRGLSARATAELRENTLRLMRRGCRIPVLPGHTAAGSIDGGPQTAPVRAVDRPAAVGRLVDLVQLPDGSLVQVIELDAALAGEKFTSPEIRPQWTDATGETCGPIIAHVALTDRPLSPGQTRLAPWPEHEPHSFSLPEGALKMSPTTERVAVAQQPSPAPKSPPAEGDAEPRERELPETDTLPPEAEPDDDTVLADESVEEIGPERLSGPETARVEQIIAQRSQLAQRIRSSRKLPKGLRDRLAELVETLQLSDDADAVPRVPVAEAVDMIEAAIPENLQFAEGPLESPVHPRGESFFTGDSSRLSSEDAQRIAKEQLAATGFGQTT